MFRAHINEYKSSDGGLKISRSEWKCNSVRNAVVLNSLNTDWTHALDFFKNIWLYNKYKILYFKHVNFFIFPLFLPGKKQKSNIKSSDLRLLEFPANVFVIKQRTRGNPFHDVFVKTNGAIVWKQRSYQTCFIESKGTRSNTIFDIAFP